MNGRGGALIVFLGATSVGAQEVPRSPSQVRAPIVGLLTDSLSGEPISGAHVRVLETSQDRQVDAHGRFSFDSIRPGRYTLEIRTPSLDSLRAIHRAVLAITDTTQSVSIRAPSGKQFAQTLCGQGDTGDGIILGITYVQDKAGLRSGAKNTLVFMEWLHKVADSIRIRRLEIQATVDGRFAACGIPLDASVKLHAVADSSETASPSVARFAPGLRLASVELPLSPASELAMAAATFVGEVLDSVGRPIVAAEISFPGAGKTGFSDATGAARILGIPAGIQNVRVRRIGFAPVDTSFAFPLGEMVRHRIVLRPAIKLDPVAISATTLDRAMRGFEENRRVGLGQFLTRTQLEKFSGMKLSTALQQLTGFSFVEGRGSAFPTSRLAPPCMSGAACYSPKAGEAQYGVRTACYALVYLDRLLVNGSRQPTEPFDINTISPESVEAVEFYASAAQTPMEYSRMGSQCGVLVIWTRRSP